MIYQEPLEVTTRRDTIRQSQLPIEYLKEMIASQAKEADLLDFLKKDLSYLGDAFAEKEDEYICLPEYSIGNRRVDFLVLTGRSRMKVLLIEVKGADFFTIKRTHYQGTNSHIQDALTQLSRHEQYINQNYHDFRSHIHDVRDSVIKGTYPSNHLLGAKGYLDVDPDKDIIWEKIIVGGTIKDDHIDSRERTLFERNHTGVRLFSWKSFVRRLDPVHGHYQKQVL